MVNEIIVNIITPRAWVLVVWRGHISHIDRVIQYLFQNLFAYSQSRIKETKFLVMITKEGSTKIVYFTAFEEAGFLRLGVAI